MEDALVLQFNCFDLGKENNNKKHQIFQETTLGLF